MTSLSLSVNALVAAKVLPLAIMKDGHRTRGSNHCWQIHAWAPSSLSRWNIGILGRNKYHGGIADDHKTCASRQQTFTLIAYKYAASSETANHNLSPVGSCLHCYISLSIFSFLSLFHRNACTEYVSIASL